MSKANLSGLGIGDVLVGSRTLKVTDRVGGRVYFEDVDSGHRFTLNDGEEKGTWAFSVIQKAKRKYKVGDRISGNEVREHQWKRNTTLLWVGDDGNDGGIYVLRSDGIWAMSDVEWEDTDTLNFNDFGGDKPSFEIVYLP